MRKEGKRTVSLITVDKTLHHARWPSSRILPLLTISHISVLRYDAGWVPNRCEIALIKCNKYFAECKYTYIQGTAQGNVTHYQSMT